MFCPHCKEDMVPIISMYSESSIETQFTPCWNCTECNEILFVQDEKEFDHWVYLYYHGYTDLNTDENEIKDLDKETIKLISTGM